MIVSFLLILALPVQLLSIQKERPLHNCSCFFSYLIILFGDIFRFNNMYKTALFHHWPWPPKRHSVSIKKHASEQGAMITGAETKITALICVMYAPKTFGNVYPIYWVGIIMG